MIISTRDALIQVSRDQRRSHTDIGRVTNISARRAFIVVRAVHDPSDAGQSEVRSLGDGLDVRFFPSGQRIGEPVIWMKNPRRFLSIFAKVNDIVRLRVIFKGEMTIGTYD